ncbi:MAG: hypothetical protein KME10_01925 [Plectolyngbya sp. WJT66-NPBG17]|jgi:hypothetical protein|nr:hypothetical protein [Plectolyngbya sp. WJT66-NPBG17]
MATYIPAELRAKIEVDQGRFSKGGLIIFFGVRMGLALKELQQSGVRQLWHYNLTVRLSSMRESVGLQAVGIHPLE